MRESSLLLISDSFKTRVDLSTSSSAFWESLGCEKDAVSIWLRVTSGNESGAPTDLDTTWPLRVSVVQGGCDAPSEQALARCSAWSASLATGVVGNAGASSRLLLVVRRSFVPAASCLRICPSSNAVAKSTEISRLAECAWRSQETSFGRARLSVGMPRARYHPSPDLHPWGNSIHGSKLSLSRCSLVTAQEAFASLGLLSCGIEGSQRMGCADCRSKIAWSNRPYWLVTKGFGIPKESFCPKRPVPLCWPARPQ